MKVIDNSMFKFLGDNRYSVDGAVYRRTSAGLVLDGWLPRGADSAGSAVIIVDYAGSGDFTSVKDACEFAATNSAPAVDLPLFGETPGNWTIAVTPGALYIESPFIVPDNVRLVGMYAGSNQGVVTDSPNILFTGVREGSCCTVGRNCSLSNIVLQVGGFPEDEMTGDLQLVRVADKDADATTYIKLFNVGLTVQIPGEGFMVNALHFDAGTRNHRYLSMRNCSVTMKTSESVGVNGVGVSVHNLSGTGSNSYMTRCVWRSSIGDVEYGVLFDNAVGKIDHCRFENFPTSVTATNSSDVEFYGGQGIDNSTSDSSSSMRMASPDVPNAGSASGVTGQITSDDDYLYVRTSSGWKRVGLSSL